MLTRHKVYGCEGLVGRFLIGSLPYRMMVRYCGNMTPAGVRVRACLRLEVVKWE